MKYMISLFFLVTSCYALDQKEINDIALKAQDVFIAQESGKVTGELKVRRFLKENYKDLSAQDIATIMKLAFKIKEDPLFKDSLINPVTDKPAVQPSDSGNSLSAEEILKLAKKAQVVWDKNGDMGEFAARRYLEKDLNILSKKERDVIIKKSIELRKAKSPAAKTKKPEEGSRKDPSSKKEINPEVEKWAQQFKNLDPDNQRIQILKGLNKESVDKSLFGEILLQIKILRADPSFNPSVDVDAPSTGRSIGADTPVAEAPKEQSFYDIEKKPEIQKIVDIFTGDGNALISFITTVRFKISKNINLLWQDLVVYFYFTTLERPSEPGQEQVAYDWLLKHTMNDIYRVNSSY